jgi:hypothetical protein
MADAPPPPAGPPDGPNQTPGDFNQAQLETIRKSEGLARSAQKETYVAKLVEEGMLPGTPAALLTKAGDWRELARRAVAATQKKEGETGEGEDAETLLKREVEYFRGKARLKITQNPTWTENERTAFKARYFINVNIFTSRALAEQNVDTLLVNATADTLPGVTPARLTSAHQLLLNYSATEDPQTGAQTDATSLRTQRDAAFDEVMRLRHEIQFAAETAYPWHVETNMGIRREFLLPAGRPFTG